LLKQGFADKPLETRGLTMKKYWQDHSLSLASFFFGLIIIGGCIPLGEGTWFDLISGIGSAFFTTGLIGLASGPLVEKNLPDKCD
jgi:hypothetical protein